jgi:hypothetical protein
MLEEFKKDIERAVREFPAFSNQILELYQLALDEIEQGMSTENEIRLCINTIDQLIDP